MYKPVNGAAVPDLQCLNEVLLWEWYKVNISFCKQHNISKTCTYFWFIEDHIVRITCQITRFEGIQHNIFGATLKNSNLKTWKESIYSSIRLIHNIFRMRQPLHCSKKWLWIKLGQISCTDYLMLIHILRCSVQLLEIAKRDTLFLKKNIVSKMLASWNAVLISYSFIDVHTV